MNAYNRLRRKMTGEALSVAVCGLLSLLASALLAGCSSQQGGDQAVETSLEQVCLGDVSMNDAMQAAQDATSTSHGGMGSPSGQFWGP